jgi:hypothetical protein
VPVVAATGVLVAAEADFLFFPFVEGVAAVELLVEVVEEDVD